MTTLYKVQNGTGFSATDNGTGDQTPTAADLVRVTTSSGDWLMAAAVGSYTYDGSGNATATPGLLGILFDDDYTGTFDAAGYDLVLGDEGFMAENTTGLNLYGNGGVLVATGPVKMHHDLPWLDLFSMYIPVGGTSGSRIEASIGVSNAGIASHLIVPNGTYLKLMCVNGAKTSNGNLSAQISLYGDIQSELYSVSVKGFFQGPNGVISSLWSLSCKQGTITFSDSTKIDVYSLQYNVSKCSVFPQGTYSSQVSFTSDPMAMSVPDVDIRNCNFLGGLDFMVMSFMGASITYLCDETTLCYGSFTLMYAMGEINFPGTVTLLGTADVVIDTNFMSGTKPAFIVNKSEGDIHVPEDSVTFGSCTTDTITIDSGASVDFTDEVTLGGVLQNISGAVSGPVVLTSASAPFGVISLCPAGFSLSLMLD